MLKRKLWVSSVCFALSVFLFGAMSAEAHFFSIVPDTTVHEVAPGSEYTAKLSFTEAFLNAEVGWKPADIFSARFVYNDGTETHFPTFERHFVSVDIKSGDQTITKRRNDYLHAQATLSKMGTVILDARGDLAPAMAYKGYSKQILNARKDGFSTQRVGGDGVLEIVPLSEVADFAPGKTVEFKVFVKGLPMKGARIEWADEKSPVVRPIGPSGKPGSPENTEEIATTDDEGIFAFTLRNAGYNCFGLMPGGIPNGKIKDGKEGKDWFASTLILDVPASQGPVAGFPVAPELPDEVSKDEKLQCVTGQPVTPRRAEKLFSASSGLTSKDLELSLSGAVTVSAKVARAARDAAQRDSKEPLPSKVNPLPVLRANLHSKSADIAVMGIDLLGSALAQTDPAKVKLLKVTGPDKGVVLPYVSDPKKFRDVTNGAFTVLNSSGDVVTTIESDKRYVLTLLIRDNGEYDLNKDPKVIVDPAVILSEEKGDSSSGGGGCDAGYGLWGLLLAGLALPLSLRRGR